MVVAPYEEFIFFGVFANYAEFIFIYIIGNAHTHRAPGLPNEGERQLNMLLDLNLHNPDKWEATSRERSSFYLDKQNYDKLISCKNVHLIKTKKQKSSMLIFSLAALK